MPKTSSTTMQDVEDSRNLSTQAWYCKLLCTSAALLEHLKKYISFTFDTILQNTVSV